MQKLNQSGNHVVIALLVVLIISVLGLGGFYVYSRNNDSSPENTVSNSEITTSERSDADDLPETLVTTTVSTLLHQGGELKVTHPESWEVKQDKTDLGDYYLTNSYIKSDKGNMIRIYERDGIGGACPLGERNDTFTLQKRVTTAIPNVVFSQYAYSDPTNKPSVLLLEDHNSEYILQEVKDMKEGAMLNDSCKLYIYNVVRLTENGNGLFISLSKPEGEEFTDMTYDDLVADPEFFKAVQSLRK